MTGWLEQEPLLRLIPFVGIFVLMALWEIMVPRRPLKVAKPYRWVNNLGINQFRERRDLRLDRLLIQPFVAPVRNYPLPAQSEDGFPNE